MSVVKLSKLLKDETAFEESVKADLILNEYSQNIINKKNNTKGFRPNKLSALPITKLEYCIKTFLKNQGKPTLSADEEKKLFGWYAEWQTGGNKRGNFILPEKVKPVLPYLPSLIEKLNKLFPEIDFKQPSVLLQIADIYQSLQRDSHLPPN